MTLKEMIEMREAALARLKNAECTSQPVEQAAEAVTAAIATPSIPPLPANTESTTAIGWRDQNGMMKFNARAPFRQRRLI